MDANIKKSHTVYTFVLLIGLSLLAGCVQSDGDGAKETPFFFDQEAIPEVTPRTSQDLLNDKDNFRFVVIDDRTTEIRDMFDRSVSQ